MDAAPSTVAPILLALVLGVSGVAKLVDLSTAEDAFLSLRLPSFLRRLRAPQLLPFGELALALLLLVCSGPLVVLVAVAALVLFVAYFVVIVRALTFDERVTCSCFGKLGLGAVDRFTAVRNAILVGLAGLALADAVRGRSVIGRMSDFTGADWWWLAGVLAAVVLTWLVSGHRGLDGTSSPSRPESDDDYVRTPIPFGRLRRPDNETVTLRALAREEPALLLYVSPTCGSCVKVIDKARTWQQRTGVVHTYLVLPMPPSDDIIGLADPEAFDLLFDPASELFNLFEAGTPTAVLLGADGLLAGGPVTGFGPVETLMDEILEQLAESDPGANDAPAGHIAPAVSAVETTRASTVAPASNLDGPSPNVTAPTPPDDGKDELDYIRRPTPFGLLTTREGARVQLLTMADTTPTILLFVSPFCGSCREVIEETQHWREALNGLPVAFVVFDETAAARLDELVDGSPGPVYLDEGGGVAATFAAGNPSMVALGPDRYLLAGPVVGSVAIKTAMDEIIQEVSALHGRMDPRGPRASTVPADGPTPPEPPRHSDRALAPSAPLSRRDGTQVVMRDHGRDRQQLLVFLSPGCEACETLADRLPSWRAALPEVDVVVVAYGSADAAQHGLIASFPDALFDVDGDFGLSLGIETPAVMLVGRDGTIAGGPALGLPECLELVGNVKAMYADS